MNTHDKSELPFYLINLDRSPDRLAMATAEFERIGQAFTRIAGIDGADVPPEYADWVSQELAVQQGNLRMIPGKIGCHLSHLKTAQAFLDSGAEAAVVCEDDVRFAPDFLPVLGEALEAASDWDLLKLSCVTWHFTVERARLPCGARLVEFVRVPGGAACYAISRRGAAKLLRHSRPIVMPFDRSLQRLWVYDLVVLGLDRYLAAGRSDIPSMITGPVDQDWWQDEKQRRKGELGPLGYAWRKQYLTQRTYWRAALWSARRHGRLRVFAGLLADAFRYPFRSRPIAAFERARAAAGCPAD